MKRPNDDCGTVVSSKRPVDKSDTTDDRFTKESHIFYYPKYNDNNSIKINGVEKSLERFGLTGELEFTEIGEKYARLYDREKKREMLIPTRLDDYDFHHGYDGYTAKGKLVCQKGTPNERTYPLIVVIDCDSLYDTKQSKLVRFHCDILSRSCAALTQPTTFEASLVSGEFSLDARLDLSSLKAKFTDDSAIKGCVYIIVGGQRQCVYEDQLYNYLGISFSRGNIPEEKQCQRVVYFHLGDNTPYNPHFRIQTSGHNDNNSGPAVFSYSESCFTEENTHNDEDPTCIKYVHVDWRSTNSIYDIITKKYNGVFFFKAASNNFNNFEIKVTHPQILN